MYLREVDQTLKSCNRIKNALFGYGISFYQRLETEAEFSNSFDVLKLLVGDL